MNTTTNQTLDIQGTQFNHAAATGKMALSVACIGLGIFLWPSREHTFWGDLDSAEANLNRWFLAVVPLIIAAILPCKAHTFLDIGNGQIVTLKYYGWFRTSNHRRSLADFDRIVVRHVCHPGGEGPDTFTGSVGLLPTNGETVFWLKEFPTTQDAMPREAYEFAIALQKSLSLPLEKRKVKWWQLIRKGRHAGDCIIAPDRLHFCLRCGLLWGEIDLKDANAKVRNSGVERLHQQLGWLPLPKT